MGNSSDGMGLSAPGLGFETCRAWNFCFIRVGNCLHLGFTRTPVVRTSRIFGFKNFRPKKNRGEKKLIRPLGRMRYYFF